MKKNLKLLTIGVILTLCAGFASCGGGSSSSSSPSGSTSTSTSTSSSTPAPTQLSAPQNIEFYSNDAGRFLGFQYILNWDDVDKAEGYIVSIGDEEIETENSQCDLYDYVTVGQEVTVTVKTKGDGEKYLDSDSSSHTCLPKYATKGLSYEHSGADGGMLASLGTCTDKNIVFPERASGAPVVGIAKSGFAGAEIENVTITKAMTIIGQYAFNSCMNLKEITIEEGSELRKIDYAAFFEGVLERIAIPKNVQEIDCYALGPSIKEITVAEESEYFCTVDGVLYSKDKTKFIYYPSQKEGTEYKILDSVTEVRGGAFYRNNFLKKIIFSDNVEVIDPPVQVIDLCDNVEEIILPKNLKSVTNLFIGGKVKKLEYPDGVETVGLFVFPSRECILPKSIKTLEQIFSGIQIYYKGTFSEWEQVQKSPVSSGTVYFYREEEPEEEGNFWHYNSVGEIEIWE